MNYPFLSDGSICQGKQVMNINKLYSALFSPEGKTEHNKNLQFVKRLNTSPVQTQAVFDPNVSPLFFQNTFPQTLQYFPSNLFYQYTNPKRVTVF